MTAQVGWNKIIHLQNTVHVWQTPWSLHKNIGNQYPRLKVICSEFSLSIGSFVQPYRHGETALSKIALGIYRPREEQIKHRTGVHFCRCCSIIYLVHAAKGKPIWHEQPTTLFDVSHPEVKFVQTVFHSKLGECDGQPFYNNLFIMQITDTLSALIRVW